jgi:hypothetical protein
MSVYGYGNLGMGYRYPRRAPKAVIADSEAWARAAIYNKGVVAENPWVIHLRKSGVYDQIRDLLQEARKTYVIPYLEESQLVPKKKKTLQKLVLFASNVTRNELKN